MIQIFTRRGYFACIKLGAQGYPVNKAYTYACHLGDILNGTLLPPHRRILVNGFWRSGTTWLQETLERMLQARSVFEPFNYHGAAAYNSHREFSIKRCLPEFAPPRYDYRFANLFMPYAPESLTAFPQTQRVIDMALRGQLVMRMYGDRRKSLRDCLTLTVVTKFTRASLCLNAIAQSFGVPIIHVCRDPRAVIASIQTLDGGHFAEDSFNQLSLVDQLLKVKDGRYRYFRQWQSDIEAIDQLSAVGRIAAYFCLTERFLEETIRFDHHRNRIMIRYEDLVISHGKAFGEVITALGFRTQGDRCDADLPSTTDWNNVCHHRRTTQERLLSWQKKLSPYDQGLIEEITQTFNMTHRLWRGVAE